MKDVIFLLIHLLTTIANLIQPGGFFIQVNSSRRQKLDEVGRGKPLRSSEDISSLLFVFIQPTQHFVDHLIPGQRPMPCSKHYMALIFIAGSQTLEQRLL